MTTDSFDQTTPLAIEPDLLDTPSAGPAAIRGSLLRTAGYLVGIGLSLVSVPLLFSHLGVDDYGRYVTVIAFVTIVQGITDVGLGQIGVREFAIRAGAQRERLMRNLVGVRLTLTACGVGLATAFAGVAGYGHAVTIGTLIAGVGMVLAVLQGTFALPLAAQLRLGWITALDLLRQILSVGGIVVLVLAGSRLLGFLAISVPVGIVVLAVTLVVVRGGMPMRPSFERAEWTLLMRSVLPFAAAVVVGTFYLRLTVVLTSLLATHRQSGYYALSFTVISVLIAIPALTVGSTLPVLARAARDDRERLTYVLARLLDVMFIVGVGLGLGVLLGAGFIADVLTAGKPGSAAAVLRLQSLAIVTQFIGSGWQYGLLALHRHRALLMISVGGLAASACLTPILVPTLQAQGAAIAFSAGEVVLAALAYLALRSARPGVRFSLRVPVRVCAAALLAAGAGLGAGVSSLPATLIGATVYLGVLFVSGAVPVELRQALLHRRTVPPLER
jgi:O-antigen/teichoic acid export membrane protein